MGLFKSIRETQKLAREIEKTTDMGALRRGGTERMAAAQQSMAQATKAANMSVTGIPATATVTAASQTGAMINLEPVVELTLTVIAGSGLPPYPATVTQPISQINLPRVQVGANLKVKVDPEDPSSLWLDFGPRSP